MRTLTAGEALKILRSLQDVCILIHRSPDGDCIGGGYALHLLLKSFGIRSKVACADTIPAMYAALTDGVEFEDFEPKCFVAVDVADRGLLGTLNEQYPDCEVKLCIDHHISNAGYAEENYWNPEASAACELMFTLLRDNGIPMTEQIARCLYVGIATDTGCFKFDNAKADTFAAIAEIKRQFPNLPYARLNRELFDLKSRGRLVLDARLMENVQMSADGKVALIYLPYAWMTELGVTKDETDGLANLPMQILGVEVAITVKQQETGEYRVSMRAGDYADVSAICQRFGGGGHVKAGGCSIYDRNPQEVCKKLMDVASAMLNA